MRKKTLLKIAGVCGIASSVYYLMREDLLCIVTGPGVRAVKKFITGMKQIDGEFKLVYLDQEHDSHFKLGDIDAALARGVENNPKIGENLNKEISSVFILIR